MNPGARAAQPRAEIGLLDVLRAPAVDVAAAVAFYRDVLGAVVQSVSAGAASVRLANVDVAIDRVDAARVRDSAVGGAAGRPAGWVPTFRVRDVGALRARLAAAGIALTRDLHDVAGGVALAFDDPAGNPLVACQYGVSAAELEGSAGSA